MSTKTTPKDFFLNLGALVALYISVVSIISLAFALINKYLPDIALNYGYDPTLSTIRWAISCLVVAFPLHVYLSRLIDKDIALAPEKKNLWVKKWSTYLTLFLTGLTIAIDLIVLINTFLGGEFTLRFVLKVIVVLAVAAFVFAVYRYDLKRTTYPTDKKNMIMVWIAAVVVLAVIIAGFISVGSPNVERLRKLDDRRTSDLSSIQNYLVTTYWQNKRMLPDSLEMLNNPIASFSVPVDPATGLSYEYRKINELSFELCAVFDMPSRDTTVYPVKGIDNSFIHEKGRTCFERTIDPGLYPKPLSN